MPEKVHRCVEKLMASKGYSKEKAIKVCQVSTGESYSAKESVQLQEVSQPSGFKVDREARVIRDVRILGPRSKNGREYTPQAIAGARELYEGIVVKYDHPDARNPKLPRPMNDTAGWTENVRASDGGIVADLHFLKSDSRAEKLCEAAERRPELFGLSHNIDGKVRRQNGKTLVEEITRVHSVDVVSDPATTRSLFESIEQEEAADMSVTITEYLDAQKEDNPSVKLLREMIDTGIVKSDFEIDEEVGKRLTKLLEGMSLEKQMEEGMEKMGFRRVESEKKEDPPASDETLTKLLEGQVSLQKQLTEIKGQMNVEKPKGGMTLTEGSNGDQDGEKSTDAKDFCRRITGRAPAA